MAESFFFRGDVDTLITRHGESVPRYSNRQETEAGFKRNYNNEQNQFHTFELKERTLSQRELYIIKSKISIINSTSSIIGACLDLLEYRLLIIYY